jgi:hypothetical protein
MLMGYDSGAWDVDVGGNVFMDATGYYLLRSTGSYIFLASDNDQDMYFDAGDDFLWRDADNGSSVTASLNSASGAFETIGTLGIGGPPSAGTPAMLYQTAASGLTCWGYGVHTGKSAKMYVDANGNARWEAAAGHAYLYPTAGSGLFLHHSASSGYISCFASTVENPEFRFLGWDPGAGVKKTGKLKVESTGSAALIADTGESLLLGADGSSDTGIEIASSGYVSLLADNRQFNQGAAGAADYSQYWDSARQIFDSSGPIYLDAGGATRVVNTTVTAGITPRANAALDIQGGRCTIDSGYGYYWYNGSTFKNTIYCDTDGSMNFYTPADAGPGLVIDYSTGDATFEDRVEEEGTFASIYVHDSSVAITVATGPTYVKMTQFTTDGESSNCTANATNDKITITEPGRYLVNGAFSFKADTANVNVLGVAFLNGVEQDQLHFRRLVSTANDEGAASFVGIVDVSSVPWDLDFRVRHDDAGDVDITVTYANLTVSYLGET